MKMNFIRNGGMVLLWLVAGCSDSSSPAVTNNTPPTGRVTIRGSNTFGEELGPALIAEYKKTKPASVFDLEAKATSYGFGSLAGGTCDIAAASRTPSSDEQEVADLHHVKIHDHIICSYSVAVVVNAANTLTNLSKDQVRDIFSGTITNWNAVGGPDAPIHLYIRDSVSGTFAGFKELAMEKKDYAKGVNLETNYQGIVDKVAQDGSGIGYASLNLATNSGVKALPIDGAAATVAAVNTGAYPYKREIHLYTRADHESPETLAFLGFVLSPQGQKIVADVGDTPVAGK